MVKAKLKATLLHFLFTGFIALVFAAVIFLVWYPPPYTVISGGIGLWKILIAVELSLGPLMSLVIYSPLKSFKQLIVDYSLVAIVQFAALAFGVHTLYSVRPVFMVFVKDRFDLITASDLGSDMVRAKSLRSQWVGPSIVGVREPESIDERNELLFGALKTGRDIQHYPKYYAELDRARLGQVVKPLEELINQLNSPEFADVKSELMGMSTNFHWIPVVNGVHYWFGVLDEELRVVKFFPVNPWALGKAAESD